MSHRPPSLMTIPAAAQVLRVTQHEVMLWMENGVLTTALLGNEPWALAEEIHDLRDQMLMAPELLLS